jgi:hypothetical protein
MTEIKCVRKLKTMRLSRMKVDVLLTFSKILLMLFSSFSPTHFLFTSFRRRVPRPHTPSPCHYLQTPNYKRERNERFIAFLLRPCGRVSVCAVSFAIITRRRFSPLLSIVCLFPFSPDDQRYIFFFFHFLKGEYIWAKKTRTFEQCN